MKMNRSRKKSSRLFLWSICIIAFLLILVFVFQQFCGDELTPPNTAAQGTRTGRTVLGAKPKETRIQRDLYGFVPQNNESSGENAPTAVAFRGVVRNEFGRDPISGAHIKILAVSNSTNTVEITTGDEGKFTIDAPPANRYEMTVEADGFRTLKDGATVEYEEGQGRKGPEATKVRPV